MQSPTWKMRRLGRTDFAVTPLGIGGAYLGRTADGSTDERIAIDTVLRGLELGLNVHQDRLAGAPAHLYL